jgi:hypothetical protein
MTEYLNRSKQIHNRSLLRFKWAVMYLHTTVQVSGHVFAYYEWSEQSCICILWFKWAVMYLYTTVSSLRSCMTANLNRTMQIHDRSLEPYYANTWTLTWTIVYKYMTAHLIHNMQIHDCSLHSLYANTWPRICILRFKWAVMYLHTTVQVSSHAFFYYGSSERSCICILWFKWAVVYLHNTDQIKNVSLGRCGNYKDCFYRITGP